MQHWETCKSLLGGGQIVGASKDQVLTICPSCRKKKFYFALRSGKGECKSGSCKAKFSSVFALERFIRKNAYTPVVGAIESSKGALDPWRNGGSAEPPDRVEATKKYLEDRNVSMEIAHQENLWAMSKSGTLIVPVYNFFTGEDTPYYRFLSGTLRWVGESGFERVHHAFLGANLKAKLREGNPGPVLVVEGVFDLLAAGLQDWGLATLGASYSTFLIAFIKRHFGEVYHLPDNDAAGEESAKKLEQLCKTYGIKYRNLNREGWLYRYTKAKDPGELFEYQAGVSKCEFIRKHFERYYEKQNRKEKL